MIVYSKTKAEFNSDVLSNYIGDIIKDHIYVKTGHKVAVQEFRAFQNSLEKMGTILSDSAIPDDSFVSIEYHLPQTSKRVDFIISGLNGDEENVLIIELKQWETAQITDRDGIVITQFKNGQSATNHPSYQAWSYAAYLKDFNETVQNETINLYACAYLHNYDPEGIIRDPFYGHYLQQAPVFLKPDALKLRSHIKQYIRQGDTRNIMGRIDNGKIRPSKTLADSMKGMMRGNKEFILLDDQKVVYEQAMHLARVSTESKKNVLIVEGGPGTGKSVVAVNLLVDIIKSGKMAKYVTKTSAPRDVYMSKLAGDMRRVEMEELFVGSGSFMKTDNNSQNVLIVDEAHRLTDRTGFLKMGRGQLQEILQSALTTVFFIDEDQRVSVADFATVKKIEAVANELGISVHKATLESQFRCNGSDGYLAWVDNVLQIRETANYDLSTLDFDFDFKVFDNPVALRDAIFEKNKINNRARMVAGYCWKWVSKRPGMGHLFDFTEEEFGFNMRWNMKSYGGKWIIEPDSVNEIGCIHTAQGLDIDYIGVIIGNDLVIRNGEVVVNPAARDSEDKTISGWVTGMQRNPAKWKPLLETIIKNTYRTLMTRGLKGCYIHSIDVETNQYLKNLLSKQPAKS